MSNEPPPFSGETYVDIGPECFTNGLVISYRGENYYKACGAFVHDNTNGGKSYCIKRVGHFGRFHESYDGWNIKAGSRL